MPSTRPLPSSRRRPAYERPVYGRVDYDRPRTRSMQSTPDWRRELDADLAAMGKVWQMIRNGATRMLGEIGRQY
jgi:hypothetical protein